MYTNLLSRAHVIGHSTWDKGKEQPYTLTQQSLPPRGTHRHSEMPGAHCGPTTPLPRHFGISPSPSFPELWSHPHAGLCPRAWAPTGPRALHGYYRSGRHVLRRKLRRRVLALRRKHSEPWKWPKVGCATSVWPLTTVLGILSFQSADRIFFFPPGDDQRRAIN